MNKLNIKAFTIATGASWSIFILILGVASSFGWGESFVKMISSLYLGFKPGIVGGVIGAIWAFVDGAIGGLIIAWIYNFAVASDK
ncbi:MAG TPA: membrane-associated protein [Candidatus Moranbacteria bacterium]|nr:membrane-associated protein [Candidatus Moranbacteria bacterium]